MPAHCKIGQGLPYASEFVHYPIVSDDQRCAIGNQTGSRVFLFLQTNDLERDYAQMKRQGVTFCETPRDKAYGRVVVFEDLYGNRWDRIESKPTPDF